MREEVQERARAGLDPWTSLLHHDGGTSVRDRSVLWHEKLASLIITIAASLRENHNMPHRKCLMKGKIAKSLAHGEKQLLAALVHEPCRDVLPYVVCDILAQEA